MALRPITLTGHAARDREAILARAAERLLPSGGETGSSGYTPAARAMLMGGIGSELLALDSAKGTPIIERALAMAACQGERVTPGELYAAGHSRIGGLIHLAASLEKQPGLREKALRAAYTCVQGGAPTLSRIYALCLFAREAAGIDPKRARAALRAARGIALLLPDGVPPDPSAAVAATTARLEGRAAARSLVERALEAIPTGRARPLVEARLATWLAFAAPERSRELARRAVAEIAAAPQRRTVAVLLAPAHPEMALKAAGAIRPAGERFAALLEMGEVAERKANEPREAAPFYRQALQEASVLPAGTGREEAVLAAATGLARFDPDAAVKAVAGRHGTLSVADRIRFFARTMKSDPVAADRLITGVSLQDPAVREAAEASEETERAVAVAAAQAEPDLRQALARAQQWPRPEAQAVAMETVAARLIDGKD